MSHFQELETAKYMLPKYQEEARQLKRLRNRKALRDFNVFLLGWFMIPIAWRANEWIPAITSTPIFRSLF